MSYLSTIFSGFWTLVTGMKITAREMPRKAVTLTYPHKKPELSDAYRSAIQLVRFEETDSHDCVACMQCVKICPSFCITIEGEKIEGIKRQRANRVEMDFALCSLCGLCIDVCPTDTLEYSKIYDEAGGNRGWTYDLLAEFREGEEAWIERMRAIEAKEAAEKEAKRKAIAEAKAAAATKKPAEEAAPKPPDEGAAGKPAPPPASDLPEDKPEEPES